MKPSSVVSGLVSAIFPPRCVICDALGSEMCESCMDTLVVAPEPEPPVGVDSVCALCSYEDGGADLVLAIKRRNRREILPRIARCLALTLEQQCRLEDQCRLEQHCREAPAPPVLTWLPTTGSRRRERGFDQAELLARQIGRFTGWKVQALIRREGGPQMGLSRAQREIQPLFAATRSCSGEVVMVDDVLTTGATAAAGATELRLAGATTVRAAFIAIAP